MWVVHWKRECRNILNEREFFQQQSKTVRLENPPISGRYDFLLKHEEYDRVILELKSINDEGFDALIETPKPNT